MAAKKRGIKISSAKSKARKLQQHVAERIKEVFKLQDGDAESRPMGSPGEDVMLSPAARAKLPVSIEVKNTKSFPSIAALKQSETHVKSGSYIIPGVVWKPFGKGMDESIIYFNLNDFLNWHKENVEWYIAQGTNDRH